MSIENHNLYHEFPDFTQQIDDLKLNDRYFLKLFDDYHEIDLSVRRIEELLEASSEQRLDELKLRRVQLKDELFDLLKKA